MDTKKTNLSSDNRLSAKERLLRAANELFYDEGVHIVGIDRVIERAGVAKATLYSAFGSKDELIRAYLTRRHMVSLEYLNGQLAAYETPRERLLGVFDVLGKLFAMPGFRGCAFMNASAEGLPNSSIEEPAHAYRASIRLLFVELAKSAGAIEPENLAQQLILLYDGAMVAARMDRNPVVAVTARSVANTLIALAIDS
ncbi:TetR/AcrR family transcriptional regulator [Cohnella endophytica]|uniref:TetR/AcrR family transcriptional regulator n=1 Tax=Cohnella endophytica TaxID=2419778 RepID=A0A494XLH9_9BACL|nr:TetR/AcrR family transcriptional regulator [Cohnella endophytica]RKP51478.1 TetR/AcrR family transcriptional regulator [Cohnella endophytica]